MNLTKSQKEALVRKAESLLADKRLAEETRLKKEWPVDDKISEYLKRFLPIQEALVSLHKAVLDAKAKLGYSYIEIDDENYGYMSLQYQDPRPENLISSWIERIRNNQIAEALNEKYPNYIAIMDELELQCLDKSFDLDSFLNKYKSL